MPEAIDLPFFAHIGSYAYMALMTFRPSSLQRRCCRPRLRFAHLGGCRQNGDTSICDPRAAIWGVSLTTVNRLRPCQARCARLFTASLRFHGEDEVTMPFGLLRAAHSFMQFARAAFVYSSLVTKCAFAAI